MNWFKKACLKIYEFLRKTPVLVWYRAFFTWLRQNPVGKVIHRAWRVGLITFIAVLLSNLTFGTWAAFHTSLLLGVGAGLTAGFDKAKNIIQEWANKELKKV